MILQIGKKKVEKQMKTKTGKQDWMRHTLQAQYPEHCGKVQFYVGDVRNLDSVRDVMYGANYVFHAAALKEVPSCEFFPWRLSGRTSSVLIM